MDGTTLLASGFGAVEGPVVDEDGTVYFGDVYGGGVYALSPDGHLETVVPRRKGVGGICLHRSGGLVIAGRDVSHVRDGHSRVLLTREAIPDGPGPVAVFGDLTSDGHGRIFASVIRQDGAQGFRGGELVMITEAGSAVRVRDGVGLPNGQAISPDGRWLYHADTENKSVAVLDLGDGTAAPTLVRELSTASEPGGPDGMATDVDGGIWIAMYQGGAVIRLTPDGGVDRRVEVPAANPLSVCFAGPDLADLIVVTMDNTGKPELNGCVHRLDVGVRGAAVGRAKV